MITDPAVGREGILRGGEINLGYNGVSVVFFYQTSIEITDVQIEEKPNELSSNLTSKTTL